MGSWNPHFSRHFNDWELEEVEGLFRKLHPLVMRREVEDVLSLKERGDGISLLDPLYRSCMRASSDLFPWGIMWRSWALMSVSFFAWEVSWNKISTINQLQRRGWNMLNWCYLCKEKEEIKTRMNGQEICFEFIRHMKAKEISIL